MNYELYIIIILTKLAWFLFLLFLVLFEIFKEEEKTTDS